MHLIELQRIFETFGYSSINLSDVSSCLDYETLHSLSSIDNQSLLSVILDNTHPLCLAILRNPEMADIFSNSLVKYDYHLPPHLIEACQFEFVFTKKDKKVLTGQAKNGLYYFLMTDESDKPFDLKPIIRKDGSHAFIIEPVEGPNHLTIDENYCDETESGKYFYHYAHISMIKNDARVRIYFDEKLHIVRTSAFIEEGGKKITKINPATLNIVPSDYQNLLDILKGLKERHTNKIKNLDLAFTPKFMFIQNLDQLRICQQEIHEINRLKAPLYDCRADYLNQETHVMEEKPKALKQSEPEPAPMSIVPKKSQTTSIIRKKTKLEIKRERIQNAKRNLDALITNIQALMDSASSDNNHFNQALEKILQLDFMFIHFIDDLDAHIDFYESQIEELKILCLLHLHAAILTNQVSYLDQVYTQGQLYIDSLIHRYMIELVKKLNHGVGSFTQSDKEKFKRVTDLLQFYCDKNELFEGFFAFLGKQLAYNPRKSYSQIWCMDK